MPSPRAFFLIFFVIAAILPAFTAYGAQSPAPGEPRTALIIGNSAYRHEPLKNPANDAEDMARMLRTLGFDVTLKKDASFRQMVEAINDFGRGLKKGGVGLFYFAGHGVQSKGRNYLVPVNANVESEAQVEAPQLDAAPAPAEKEEQHQPLSPLEQLLAGPVA